MFRVRPRPLHSGLPLFLEWLGFLESEYLLTESIIPRSQQAWDRARHEALEGNI